MYNEYKRIKTNTKKLKIDYKLWHYRPFKAIDEMMSVKEDLLLYSLKQKYFKNKLHIPRIDIINKKNLRKSVINIIGSEFNRIEEEDKPRKRLIL